MQTTSLCRKVCWVHTIKQNKQPNWEDLYQTLSHFSQHSEALFILTNPVTKGSESQSPVDLTLPAASLISVLEVPPQLQGQPKGPCICSSIAAFHNPAISLYLWWLRALKLCGNWEGAGKSWKRVTMFCLLHGAVCSCPQSNAQHEAATLCHPCQLWPTILKDSLQAFWTRSIFSM